MSLTKEILVDLERSKEQFNRYGHMTMLDVFNRMDADAAEIATLRDVLMHPDPDNEPDVARLHREKCEALDEVYRLRGALEPFAKLAEFISENHRDTRPIIYGLDPAQAGRLTIGDLRRAAKALSPAERGR
jgi:hypothetical protein